MGAVLFYRKTRIPCRKTRLRGGWLAVIALLTGVCAAATSVSSNTALPDAAMKGDIQAMKSLLKGGADPNALGQFGTPALHWRVDVDDLAGVQLLLSAGADANRLTERGVSPLSLAIANGNAAMVDVLLKAGANASQLEPTGETQLMMASQVGVAAVVQSLLKKGAQVNASEANFGQTALMY